MGEDLVIDLLILGEKEAPEKVLIHRCFQHKLILCLGARLKSLYECVTISQNYLSIACILCVCICINS